VVGCVFECNCLYLCVLAAPAHLIYRDVRMSPSGMSECLPLHKLWDVRVPPSAQAQMFSRMSPSAQTQMSGWMALPLHKLKCLAGCLSLCTSSNVWQDGSPSAQAQMFFCMALLLHNLKCLAGWLSLNRSNSVWHTAL